MKSEFSAERAESVSDGREAKHRRFRFRLASVVACLAFAAESSAQESSPADEFTSTNDLDKRIFTKQAGGFRIQAPPPKKPAAGAPKEARATAVNPTLWRLDTTYAADGDFEYAVNYSAAELGLSTGTMPGEANAEIGVLGRGSRGHIGLNVNVDPKAGKRFSVVRISSNAGGQHFNIVPFPRKSDVGSLSIRRVKDELLFLVADGADAPLRELLRYPYDPTIQPNFRVSAFHHQGAEANPVDVLFGNVLVKAARIVRGPQAGYVPQAAAAPASYPAVLDYSKNLTGFLTDFPHTDDKVQAFRIEGGALRIRPPTPPYKNGAQSYYFRESRYAVVGDFEWSCDFDVDKVGPFGAEGYGSCAVAIQIETKAPIGWLAVSVGASRSRLLCCGVTRHSPSAKGSVYDTQEIAAPFRKGRMILRRTGAEVVAAIHGNGQPTALELCRMSWVSAPVRRLGLATDQGGNCSTPVDVKLTNIRVKAQSFADEASGVTPAVSSAKPQSGEPPTSSRSRDDRDAAPPTASRKWQYLSFAGVVLTVGGVLAAFLIVRLRRNG